MCKTILNSFSSKISKNIYFKRVVLHYYRKFLLFSFYLIHNQQIDNVQNTLFSIGFH